MFGAISDLNACALTDVFIIGALISVLESAPAADVVDQNDVELSHSGLDICNQLLKRCTPADGKATFAIIGIGLDDLDTPLFCVFADLVGLVVSRILLMLRRHAHILRRPEVRHFAVTAIHCITLLFQVVATFACCREPIKSILRISPFLQCFSGAVHHICGPWAQ